MTIMEFLLEEPSMENVLRELLPRILPGVEEGRDFFLRPHNGKSDLRRSIPQKVKAFSHPGNRRAIIILHDQDSNDCIQLKRQIVELCELHGDCPVLVRIVCRELEAWYLGDMDAIQSAYPRFSSKLHRNKAKFRDPDSVGTFDQLAKLVPNIQKGSASRTIPKFMTIDSKNKSRSFEVFVSGIRKLHASLP